MSFNIQLFNKRYDKRYCRLDRRDDMSAIILNDVSNDDVIF